MLRKKIAYIISGFSLFLACLQPAIATAASHQYSLPENAGVYSVPGHSKLKLRVFVHSAKGGHGGGSPTPTLACSLSDPDSTTSDGTTGWHLPSGTWTYHLNTSSAPLSIGANNMAILTANAFGAWNSTSVGNSVSFSRGSDTTVTRSAFDGKNIVSWGRTQGTALAVTYTWYNTTTGIVSEEDTIFNNKFAWNWADQSVNPGCAYQGYYDAQNILTHELGHWMGLDDNYDSGFVDNTMYGYGSTTEVKKDTLSTGDIAAINSIY